MVKKKPIHPQAQPLPFPPAGLQYEPGGMVEAALQLGGVVREWGEVNFFDAGIAKQTSESDQAMQNEAKQ